VRRKHGLLVAVYGDSLVMAGKTTPLAETFVERLGAHLRSGAAAWRSSTPA
jgi:hypothetical protein